LEGGKGISPDNEGTFLKKASGQIGFRRQGLAQIEETGKRGSNGTTAKKTGK